MIAFCRKRKLLLSIASTICVGVLVFETKLAYHFFPHNAFSSALESLSQSVGSEARLTWLLERQGFEVERVSDTFWGQSALKGAFTDCDFSESDLRSYSDCQDSRYEAFIDEIGYDPEHHATLAHADMITYLVGICERKLLIFWIARTDQIEHVKASSQWSCL